LRFENVTALTDGYVQFAGLKLEQGSIATDWTPAPEDKVNVSDMRKPASDVAGIEEVNAKQDKIGYTPADDSKVVHSTLTQLNSTDMNTVLTAGFYRSFNGTNGIPSGDNWTIYQIIPLSDDSANGVQLAYETNSTVLGLHSWKSINGVITFNDWVQFAEDSKVAHLSGANNFDTVPTVNNNPLLLASSLPTDLARTGSNQEFTGKNTFDTAPIDKTTGNPYITKSDVPKVDLSSYATNSQLATKADDSKVVHNTGTEEIAGQKTFDTAPIDKTTGNPYITKSGVPAVPSTLADTTKDTNFTGKLQKSGIDVATKSDVSNAVSTAVSNSSKYIEASNNDEASAIFESQSSNLGNIYYWYEG